MTPMTPKQKRFADEYLIDLNATAAYKRAGYKGTGNSAESMASQLLSNIKVAHYVKSELDKRSEELGIDQKYVLSTIKETVDRCRQARPVLNKQGEPLLVETVNGTLAAAYTFDAGNVLKGSELLGRHVGIKGFTKDNENTPMELNVNIGMDQNMLEAARRIAYVLARGSGRIINQKKE